MVVTIRLPTLIDEPFEVFNKYELVNYQEEAYYLALSLYLERVYTLFRVSKFSYYREAGRTDPVGICVISVCGSRVSVCGGRDISSK